MNSQEKKKTIKKLQYRKTSKILFLIGILGFILTLILSVFFEEINTYSYDVAVPLWWLTLFAGLYMHNVKCPICENKFSSNHINRTWNDFTSSCMNCGLKENGENIDKSYQ